MKVLVVISLAVSEDNPEEVIDVIQHIDPPTIPHFDHEVRIVVDKDAEETIKFLDGPPSVGI